MGSTSGDRSRRQPNDRRGGSASSGGRDRRGGRGSSGTTDGRSGRGSSSGRGGRGGGGGGGDRRGGSRATDGRVGGSSSGGRDGRGGSRSTDGRARTGSSQGGRGKSPGRRGAPSGYRRTSDADDQQPQTEAQRRSAAIRAKKRERRPGSRYRIPPPPGSPEAELLAEASDQPRSRQQHDGEAWIDEGPVDPVLRHAAVAATHRAAKRRSRLEPGTEAELVAVLGERDARELAPQLSAAADALDRDRLEDARRLMAPLLRQFPDVAAVQETAGLVSYRLGRWKQAARQLERAQELHTNAESLPVLGDCYRALGRHTAVERTWKQLKNASPRHETMTEGRIVMAGSLADRGDLKAAIELLDPGAKRPKRIRDHHLRQWYALADLYDRAGDPVRARHWFTVVANQDAEFVDVLARLGSLGR